jgi:hypothetical protein
MGSFALVTLGKSPHPEGGVRTDELDERIRF